MKDKKAKQVPTQLDPAETVREMAKGIIAKHHSHLANCNIAYLYTNKPMARRGKIAIATAEKCSPKAKALTLYNHPDDEPFDFVVTVSYGAWNRLTDKQKLAVLDHELTHCFVEENEEGEVLHKILGHDFEDFHAILSRHGLYLEDLQAIKNALK